MRRFAPIALLLLCQSFSGTKGFGGGSPPTDRNYYAHQDSSPSGCEDSVSFTLATGSGNGPDLTCGTLSQFMGYLNADSCDDISGNALSTQFKDAFTVDAQKDVIAACKATCDSCGSGEPEGAVPPIGAPSHEHHPPPGCSDDEGFSFKVSETNSSIRCNELPELLSDFNATQCSQIPDVITALSKEMQERGVSRPSFFSDLEDQLSEVQLRCPYSCNKCGSAEPGHDAPPLMEYDAPPTIGAPLEYSKSSLAPPQEKCTDNRNHTFKIMNTSMNCVMLPALFMQLNISKCSSLTAGATKVSQKVAIPLSTQQDISRKCPCNCQEARQGDEMNSRSQAGSDGLSFLSLISGAVVMMGVAIAIRMRGQQNTSQLQLKTDDGLLQGLSVSFDDDNADNL
ncbi:hypothetical protein CYMTET_29414 [Cymbomonas tetramitiformis]|uniref:Uncharacterized protein n=1 Tax=Cymbomonas tetramitiformis TaxID=36881 RepID=A0AAE0KUY2_9CHLO|nr:hypothetical protein CYMTET_29414 [Cymbomonas tetramitiformis]